MIGVEQTKTYDVVRYSCKITNGRSTIYEETYRVTEITETIYYPDETSEQATWIDKQDLIKSIPFASLIKPYRIVTEDQSIELQKYNERLDCWYPVHRQVGTNPDDTAKTIQRWLKLLIPPVDIRSRL